MNKTGRPKSVGLTKRQAEAMQVICQFYRNNGRMPSMQDIGDRLEIAAPSVYLLIQALLEKGYLRKILGGRNRYEIRKPVERKKMVMTEIPLLGTIPCGHPVEPMVSRDNETVLVDSSLTRGAVLFALKMDGTSMSQLGYKSGDVAVIRYQPVAENQDIVAVMLNGAATLKRLIYTAEQVAIKWEDGSKRIHVIQYMDDFKIIGKLIKHITEKEIKNGYQ